ncbi:hypothetical protein SETIT_2G059800v2 [Setaria italica]|uniref:Uncharacterized protein n=1 Tax=Setaria italica TaxID=4555 RepID=A0A368PVR1_SETIT|nr:hypothetical protein SETIT_2G059800v2 [Setaria italica]
MLVPTGSTGQSDILRQPEAGGAHAASPPRRFEPLPPPATVLPWSSSRSARHSDIGTAWQQYITSSCRLVTHCVHPYKDDINPKMTKLLPPQPAVQHRASSSLQEFRRPRRHRQDAAAAQAPAAQALDLAPATGDGLRHGTAVPPQLPDRGHGARHHGGGRDAGRAPPRPQLAGDGDDEQGAGEQDSGEHRAQPRAQGRDREHGAVPVPARHGGHDADRHQRDGRHRGDAVRRPGRGAPAADGVLQVREYRAHGGRDDRQEREHGGEDPPTLKLRYSTEGQQLPRRRRRRGARSSE